MNQVPLFVPFKVRNQIINENCTKQKDIIDLPSKSHYQTLLSYMTERQVHDGVQKRISDRLTKRTKAPIANYDQFRKGRQTNVRQVFKAIINSHKSSTLSMMLGIPYPTFANASLNRGGTSNIDDTDLKAYWKFNETSGDIINQSQSAADLGAGADLQVTGASYNQASGPFNYSMLFDGVDDHAVSGTSLSQYNFMHNTSALFTVALWMRVRSLVQDEVVFDNTALNLANIGVLWRFASTNRLELNIFRGVGGTFVLDHITTNNYVPDTTNWYFYVWTYDQGLGSNNSTIKRNDANSENGSKTANAPSGSDATHALRFARNANSAANFGDYYIAECSVWNKIMSASDQTSLYNSGNGLEIY